MKLNKKFMDIIKIQGFDLSLMMRLKQNEIALKGVKNVFDIESYQELLDHEEDLIRASKDDKNPCFSLIANHTFSLPIENFPVVNFRHNEHIRLKELNNLPDLYEYEKDEMIIKSLELYSEEYRIYHSKVTKNFNEILVDYSKVKKFDFEPLKKILKKYFRLFLVSTILFLIVDHIEIVQLSMRHNLFYSIMFNLILNGLIIFSFIKLAYLKYIKHIEDDYTINMFNIDKKCQNVLSQHHKNIEALEKTLHEYGHTDHVLSFEGFINNHHEIIKLNEYIIDHMTKEFLTYKDSLYRYVHILNYIFLYSVLLLLILFIIFLLV